MKIGTQILHIRQEHHLTQEQFGVLFHVTRQTVSNWENEKSYPDLQTLIGISDHFSISLDALLRRDTKLVETIDKERLVGTLRRNKPFIDALTGAGVGILASCLFSPSSERRTLTMIVGFTLLAIGWYKKATYDKKVFRHLDATNDR